MAGLVRLSEVRVSLPADSRQAASRVFFFQLSPASYFPLFSSAPHFEHNHSHPSLTATGARPQLSHCQRGRQPFQFLERTNPPQSPPTIGRYGFPRPRRRTHEVFWSHPSPHTLRGVSVFPISYSHHSSHSHPVSYFRLCAHGESRIQSQFSGQELQGVRSRMPGQEFLSLRICWIAVRMPSDQTWPLNRTTVMRIAAQRRSFPIGQHPC